MSESVVYYMGLLIWHLLALQLPYPRTPAALC